MKPLTKVILAKFLKTAPKKLEGEWVLLGGALLPALGVETRVTTDIDLVPLTGGGSASSTLALMDLASGLGLPVEAVNSAAGYFLSKIKDHRKQLVLMDRSGAWSLYRPNFALFLRLKASRLSESDLSDIREYARLFPEELKVARKENLPWIEKLLRAEKIASKADRLEALKALLRSG